MIDLGKTARRVVLLDLMAGACLASFLIVAGEERTLDGYYLGVARHAGRSIGELAGYCAWLILGGGAFEFALRLGIQGFFRKQAFAGARVAGIVVATLLYGLAASSWGFPAAAYCLLLGLFAALCFESTGDWIALTAWQVQWNLLAVAGTILCALAFPGAAREAFIYDYKLSQIEGGELRYESGWGWVDLTHYHTTRERLERLARALGKNRPRRIVVTGQSNTAYGTQDKIARVYLLEPEAGETPARIEAVAAGMALDMAYAEEQAQESAGFFTGLELSAWQFDDLSSVVLACLDGAAGSSDRFAGALPASESAAQTARFEREGKSLVRLRVTRPAPPPGSTPRRLAFLAEVEKQRALWRPAPHQ